MWMVCRKRVSGGGNGSGSGGSKIGGFKTSSAGGAAVFSVVVACSDNASGR